MATLPNIVLVHGAWADGSSWSAVVERLQADGYPVSAPQFPLTSLAENVARLRQVLSDSTARYYGLILNDESLTPGATHRIGSTTFEEWFDQSHPTA